MSWRIYLTAFLTPYVSFPEDSFDVIGLLKQDCIKEGLNILVSNEVFTKHEIVKKVFKDFDVFIPMTFFD